MEKEHKPNEKTKLTANLNVTVVQIKPNGMLYETNKWSKYLFTETKKKKEK